MIADVGPLLGAKSTVVVARQRVASAIVRNTPESQNQAAGRSFARTQAGNGLAQGSAGWGSAVTGKGTPAAAAAASSSGPAYVRPSASLAPSSTSASSSADATAAQAQAVAQSAALASSGNPYAAALPAVASAPDPGQAPQQASQPAAQATVQESPSTTNTIAPWVYVVGGLAVVGVGVGIYFAAKGKRR